ncbi:hypothetical protein NE237_030881 [Protea cynaroides]|uniref:Ubiquitin-like-conjugating enzyme ATG10 n=1 Tax=Protea cynaroides TaxID=273540 RepID=A0A9Q0JVA1_9MAGN|nr:hypothetical protein NE237_030881 [Protea cynaroides]
MSKDAAICDRSYILELIFFFLNAGNLQRRFGVALLERRSLLPPESSIYGSYKCEETMNISSWNGTLSSSDFYAAARILSEKWKQINPTLPWKWVPLPRSPWVASHVGAGYLSLEKFWIIKSNEEVHDERASTSKEESSYLPNKGPLVDATMEVHDERALTDKEESSYAANEEPLDDATMVQSYDEETHFFDFHIVHSASYRVPVLYFRAYSSDGRFLALDDMKTVLPHSSLKILEESKWTFITQEEHPYLNQPWYTLHPCGTSEWMKLLFLGDDSLTKEGTAIQLYLVSWLSVVGQVVGLRIPLGMLNSSRELCIPSSGVD